MMDWDGKITHGQTCFNTADTDIIDTSSMRWYNNNSANSAGQAVVMVNLK